MPALDNQNAIMQGVSRYWEWRRKFLASWQEQLQKGQLKQAWALMPAEMKQWIKDNYPDEYEQALSVIQGD